MKENQITISQFYNDTSYSGYSVVKTKISNTIRNKYPDLKGEMNKILADSGGYIKVSNIYDNSIEFKYNKKFNIDRHDIINTFNDVFKTLLCYDNNMIRVLNDMLFQTYSFQPQSSINRDFGFIQI